MTIFLSNEKDRWVWEAGYACSNELGYYSIIYSPTGKKLEIVSEQKLFLTISKLENKILYRDMEAVCYKRGEIVYWDIIIQYSNGGCIPPEPDG